MAVMGRKGNRLIPMLLVAGAVVLAGVMALALGLSSSSQSGAHALDPSDDGNFNTYSLVNDLKAPVVVYLCTDAKCTEVNSRASLIPLAAGESVKRSEYWDPGVQYGFRIAISPHARRCLLINASAKAPGTVTVPLSTATTCPAIKP